MRNQPARDMQNVTALKHTLPREAGIAGVARRSLPSSRAAVRLALILFVSGVCLITAAPAQSGNQQSGNPPSGVQPVLDENSLPVDDQTGVQQGNYPSAQPAYDTLTQPGHESAPQPGMEPEAQPGQEQEYPLGQQPGLAQGMQMASQGSAPDTMAAEQMIAILREEPDALHSIKIEVAQRSGADPDTIADETLYNMIRQDAGVRDIVLQEFARVGIDTRQAAEGYTQQRRTGQPSASRPTRTRPSLSPQPPPYEDPNRPQVRPQVSPYRNLPALNDLYSQFPEARPKLRRFGSESFLLGTGNARDLPMDLPAGPDYVLGPGDTLVLNMWGSQSMRQERPIDRQGQIALPEAGTVSIAGLTIAQAQAAIQKALGTQFQNERVEISLGKLRTVRVYVVGDVQRPGAYDISSLSTPLNALFAAGGPTSRGSLRILRQFRGQELVREIDLYDLLLKGVRSNIERLLPGDTLLVPPAGAQVAVEGMVRRPAIYELNGERSLSQAIELAGGVLASASLRQIRVERIEAHQRRTMVEVQLPQGPVAAIGPDATGFRLQDGDDVLVSQIAPYNEQAVYLEGHVYRPGKYPYREGMTVGELLRSYEDLMPEPADHAEIVRLEAPDFRPVTIGFSLPEAMIGNTPIALQPFDMIRVFSRYAIDAPRVSIAGEVLRPGTYPMSKDMTVAGLVRMAGGFKRSAYRQEADLSSYQVVAGQSVLVKNATVAVEKALEGDAAADVALKPGDVVSIRQLAGWRDIGASVTVNGEVEHDGTYGIEQGERLSSVLKRAGGFREGAYPQGAVLERVQVRELGERNRLEMIRRIETTPLTFNPGLLSGQDQAEVQQAAQQQRDQVLAALRNHPASGRLVIDISPDIAKWEHTPADIEMRAGDTLLIPRRQSFVLVSGQVYNAAAITFVPGKDAAWYLRQAGGPTHSGDKGAAFIVRANGSVVGRGGTWLAGSVLDAHMKPGDSIVVPEKAVGSQIWKNILSAAQIASSVAITGAVAGVF